MPESALRLSEVARRLECDGRLVTAVDADVSIAGVCDDSRRVRPGDLFCAWAGTAVDGHRFVAAAERAGAVAALVERPVPECAVPQLVVRDGRRAAALAAALAYGDPGESLRLIAVTGTNGKTTTVWLIRHLLDADRRAASIGTLGVTLNDERPLPGGETLTTPGPVDMARVLRELADHGIGTVAMEASSHALEQGRVHALRFDAAVFTNLTRDHLDYHGDMESYRSAKRSLATLLRAGGTMVVNVDDPAWSGLTDSAPRVVRFGLESREADVRARNVALGAFGARFRLVAPDGEAPVELPLLGAYNLQNALAAAAACTALGESVGAIAERLATVPQVPGRLERISGRPCTVLRDYAHTPDALERVLAAIRPLVEGRLIVVFGAGGDRDRGKRPLMGAVAERWSDIAIVTSDNPRTEDPDAIIDEIVAGMGYGAYRRITGRREAIAHAFEVARPEDVILLAGKGHEAYQVVGTERRPFDERQVVHELLDARVREVDA